VFDVMHGYGWHGQAFSRERLYYRIHRVFKTGDLMLDIFPGTFKLPVNGCKNIFDAGTMRRI